MSTEWVYVCVSHDPPIYAGVDDDMGHASRADLEQDIARRVELMKIPDFVWTEWTVTLPRHYRWLRQHRTCEVELQGDNGQGTVGHWYSDGSRLVDAEILDAEPIIDEPVVVPRRYRWLPVVDEIIDEPADAPSSNCTGGTHVFKIGTGDPNQTCDCGRVYWPMDGTWSGATTCQTAGPWGPEEHPIDTRTLRCSCGRVTDQDLLLR